LIFAGSKHWKDRFSKREQACHDAETLLFSTVDFFDAETPLCITVHFFDVETPLCSTVHFSDAETPLKNTGDLSPTLKHLCSTLFISS
jgi:hypothetical protein